MSALESVRILRDAGYSANHRHGIAESDQNSAFLNDAWQAAGHGAPPVHKSRNIEAV